MENNINEKEVTENKAAEGAEVKKTSLGMEENLEGLLCYLFGWVTGLIFLLAEKNSKFVKFHAVQSLILGVVLFLLYIVLDNILAAALWSLWGVITTITTLLGIGYLILTIYLMVKTYKKETVKLPIIGAYAEKASSK